MKSQPQTIQTSFSLPNRSDVTGIIQNHYTNFRNNHRTSHPLHRKLQISACFRIHLGNEDVIAKLDEHQFRGLRFRRLLQKASKMVYLIDEFRTSQCCPAYENFG
ncbi:uncharacterized protein EV154DRAFT_416904 [Mucor mucedo]|uniref:uncharacterized protein n=1 Tax=Mucor mucedo TaxID=29922 RepID=UPI0022203081|nr:uncharacterized protein EV154DRAFT_416904 [Mucor mucedo]KAI7893360.1 hypothetical protein EV154DRAFT_416904 [Mucor mucedo]